MTANEQQIRGRLAPTPSGHLHLGNARSFLITWLAARAAQGKVILRIEDIDRDRVRPEYERGQLEDLAWLGLDWDEGPDVGGPYAPYRQSERLDTYRDALEQLKQHNAVFPCICSRKDIAASAPHAGEEARYPGTCRDRFDSESDALKSGKEIAWRMRVDPGQMTLNDKVAGLHETDTNSLVGDFVVFRKNGWPAYQLAVVVDDAAMQVNQVIRGADLLDNTARQILLYSALGLQPPGQWAHLPLVLDEHGERMAKRNDSCALRNLREQSVPPERVLGYLAHSIGLLDIPKPVTAQELIAVFSWDKLIQLPVILSGDLLL